MILTNFKTKVKGTICSYRDKHSISIARNIFYYLHIYHGSVKSIFMELEPTEFVAF
jgi:hypothetical protein